MNNKIKICFAIAITSFVLSTHAAVDQFLLLGNEIKGESQDKAYKDSIDVLAWSWNAAQSGTTHVSGGGSGKSSFADVSVTKYIDSSSTVLLNYLAMGTPIEFATLKMRKPGGKPFNFQEIVMYDVLVTSVSTGGSGGEDRLTENISLNFRTFCVRYTEQTPEGSVGRKPEVCWNIGGNQSCTAAQLRPFLELPIADVLPMGELLQMNPICTNT